MYCWEILERPIFELQPLVTIVVLVLSLYDTVILIGKVQIINMGNLDPKL